jgi:hypothetical protein
VPSNRHHMEDRKMPLPEYLLAVCRQEVYPPVEAVTSFDEVPIPNDSKIDVRMIPSTGQKGYFVIGNSPTRNWQLGKTIFQQHELIWQDEQKEKCGSALAK